MKNVYLISTDNPSRLIGNEKGIILSNDTISKYLHLIQAKYYNIYITNDEEIKKGDWYLASNKLEQCSCKEEAIDLTDACKKIILTTDPQLIGDGVQAIDDKFLEWFVKNPSCEWVEVEKENICARCHSNDVDECWSAKECSNGRYDKIRYKIIIQKEELNYNMKEEILAEMERLEKEEPKQETNHVGGTIKIMTAVEFLYGIMYVGNGVITFEQFHQALDMHEEQIKNAYKADRYPCSDEDAQQYYNETYKK